MNKALNYVFARDRDFQDYLKSSDARHVIPRFACTRAALPADTKPKPIPKAIAGVESIESARLVKP